MSSAATTLPAWCRSTLAIALLGSLLLWAALPPLALGWLGWIAPIPWLVLIRRDDLPGRRPYGAIYLAGLVFWLIAIHWLRLPHPLVHLGWIALSAYLAVYLPLCIGLSRVGVHRFNLPLWLVAPIVWTGLELARAHMLTGFMMASLAHTQVNWTSLIQISDLAGEYAVGFVIILVAACVASMWRKSYRLESATSARPQSEIRNPQYGLRFHPLALVPAAIVLCATLAYGHYQLSQSTRISSLADHTNGPRIALIQGNSLSEWKSDPNKERRIMDEYMRLSQEAVAKAPSFGNRRHVDLVVWPETMFRTPLITFDPGFRASAEQTQTTEEIASFGPHDLAAVVSRLRTPVLVGVDRVVYRASRPDRSEQAPAVYNAAVLVDRNGKVAGKYDKLHRVMFGEYIPFANWLPFLYSLTPLSGGIEPGSGPIALWLDSTYCFAPDICYETAIPHVIRRQVSKLDAQNEHPTALVNLTNDAWFWGSSELQMHLACDVFRAVETRLPLVIAANGGISAWIDRDGRIREQLPRQQPGFILADVESAYVHSWYVELGDWFSGVCLVVCVVFAGSGWRARRQLVKTARPADPDPTT